MELVDFTSHDDIRAALGVTDNELPNATLSLPLYVNKLRLELDSISPDLIDFAATVDEVAIADRTTLQQRFAVSLQLFATYAVARHLCASLPLFAPKEVTDGKASISRWAQDPYKLTISRVTAECESSRAALADAYALTQSTSAPAAPTRIHFLAVTPTPDPVTGV